jgi:phage tail P2-like protein
MAIDIRSPTLSLLDFLPSSIKSEPEIVAMSKALDPEIRAVVAAIAEANILPRIDDQPEWVLDELAWAFKIDELLVWSALDEHGNEVKPSVAGKRRMINGIVGKQRKAGTRWSVRKALELIAAAATLTEWWEEGGLPYTYKVKIHADEDDVNKTQLLAVRELMGRYAPLRSRMSELAVESDRAATLRVYPAATIGRHVTIGFGAP